MKKQSIKEFKARVKYLTLNRVHAVAFKQASREFMKEYGEKPYGSYKAFQAACKRTLASFEARVKVERSTRLTFPKK